MKLKINQILPILQSLPAIARDANSVDLKFYRIYYEDLRGFDSGKLLSHYLKHGKAEGRHPNFTSLLKNLEGRYGPLPANFNAVSYRALNPDLNRIFPDDSQLIGHYLMHGRQEGRKYTSANIPTGERKVHAWENIFEMSHFMAWNSDWLPKAPLTREDAINAFIAEGIDRLSPINFGFVFDASFYRMRYRLPAMNDVELYRDWLFEGLEKGRAPNEERAIYAMLGGQPYPDSYDWRRYAAERCKNANLDRVDALQALFDAKLDNNGIKTYFNGMFPEVLFAIGNYKLIRGHYSEARDAFALACEQGACSSATLHLLGDAYAGLNKKQDAIETFVRASELPGSSIWSLTHAARLYIDICEHEKAFELLALNRGKWAGNPRYLDAVVNAIDHYFDFKTAQARKIYQEVVRTNSVDKRREADGLLMNAMSKIAELAKWAFGLQETNQKVGGKHVAFLANKDLRQCTHYRVEQKVRQFEDAGVAVKVTSHNDPDEFIQSLVGARVAIFYRVPAVPKIIKSILVAKSLGLDTYYEIDDLIFDSNNYPEPFDSFAGQITPDDYVGLMYGAVLTRFAMSMCDYAIASTPSLKKEMEKYVVSGRGILHRNGLDQRNDWLVSVGSKERPFNKEVRLFYGSGTKAHNSDFNELVGPALVRLMQSNNAVRLVVAGHLSLDDSFAGLVDRIDRYEFLENVDQYWSILASCDINIAVLKTNIFNDCKSEIKWLEAALFQIPSVVSGTVTYREIIDVGRNGLIADNPDQWFDRLSELVADRSLRAAIGMHARDAALRNYSLSTLSQRLSDVFAVQAVAEQRRPHILVVNVFFAPQTIGGATRVVEDNVKYISEKYGKEFEITILASDEGAQPAGRVRFETVDGLRVIRVSTPLEVNMDLRAFNELNEEIFRQIVEYVEPDAIHFHCIQRLTASIAKVAIDYRIPYAITIHDGWWISNNQFLVDEDGILKLPTTDILADSADFTEPTSYLERRQKLAAIMRHAYVRLSVSKSFAEIYKAAGVEGVDVNENGVSAMSHAGRPNRSDGRVALGHIGGRAAHKGAFLLEAVLRRFPFENLHLTMIDGSLAYGQSVETVWGTTPVVLKGAYPQECVGDLYSELDVVVAPSTWPESYGLVSREAISLGRWVVSSNLGAMADPVQTEKNGFIVDTSSLDDLRRVLAQIDKDPARFRAQSDNSIPLFRSSDEQAEDMVVIYREMTQHAADVSSDLIPTLGAHA